MPRIFVIECYKAVFGLNGLNFNDDFEYCQSEITRAMQIVTKEISKSVFKFSFFVRIIKHWNDLSNHLFNEGHNIKNF